MLHFKNSLKINRKSNRFKAKVVNNRHLVFIITVNAVEKLLYKHQSNVTKHVLNEFIYNF